MRVVVVGSLEGLKVVAHPGDAFVQALVQRNMVCPAQLGPHLGAVQVVSRVFAHALAHHFHVVLKRHAQLGADALYQFSDGNYFTGRDVVRVSVMAFLHDPPGGIGYVCHVDERTGRHTAAVQLQLAPKKDEQNGARNNAVQLLARSIHIGGAGGDHRKVVGRMKCAQAHVRSGARYGVRRARVKWEVLVHKTGAAAVNLGGGNVHIALQEIAFAQHIVQLDSGHHIGHEPVLGVLPALPHHALGGEVDHMFWPDRMQQLGDVLQVLVQVQHVEGEPAVVAPLVGQHGINWLCRAAGANDIDVLLKRKVHKAGAGE